MQTVVAKIETIIDQHVCQVQLIADLSGALETVTKGHEFLKAKMDAEKMNVQGDGSVIKEKIYV
jgi:hypothetical protein